MKIKFKKLSKEARLLPPAKIGDAGHDIGFVSVSQSGKYSGSIDEFGNICYYTGIALQMPRIWGLLKLLNINICGFGFMKSSGSNKKMILANAVGVVGFGYRGEIVFKFKKLGNTDVFKHDEMVAQLIFMPVFTFGLKEVLELDSTDRGSKGYGDATKERAINNLNTFKNEN